MKTNHRNIVIFVNAIRPATFAALQKHFEKTGQKLEPIVLVDKNIKDSITARNGQTKHVGKVEFRVVDFNSPHSVRVALQDIQQRIFAVTSQYENSVHELKKLEPYLPYQLLPSLSSLEWSTEKLSMRTLMEAYDASLVPQFTLLNSADDEVIEEIANKMKFPMVVKPSGLEGSLLVSMVRNKKELIETIDYTFSEIQNAYDIWIKRQKPKVLVEEFMDGEMYSIDTYVSKYGVCKHTPPVRIVTGRNVGFDDFFGYMRLTPTELSPQQIAAAEEAAEKACKALGLRSVTAHVELMKVGEKWMIIELGPRIGGYRHDMYSLSFDINHIVNDIINRAGEEPIINKVPVGYTALFNIYAKTEGYFKSFTGIDTIEQLDSFVHLKQTAHVGEKLLFAKNNGDPVFEILLHNKDINKLKSDIALLEESLVIDVTDEPQKLLPTTK